MVNWPSNHKVTIELIAKRDPHQLDFRMTRTISALQKIGVRWVIFNGDKKPLVVAIHRSASRLQKQKSRQRPICISSRLEMTYPRGSATASVQRALSFLFVIKGKDEHYSVYL